MMRKCIVSMFDGNEKQSVSVRLFQYIRLRRGQHVAPLTSESFIWLTVMRAALRVAAESKKTQRRVSSRLWTIRNPEIPAAAVEECWLEISEVMPLPRDIPLGWVKSVWWLKLKDRHLNTPWMLPEILLCFCGFYTQNWYEKHERGSLYVFVFCLLACKHIQLTVVNAQSNLSLPV